MINNYIASSLMLVLLHCMYYGFITFFCHPYVESSLEWSRVCRPRAAARPEVYLGPGYWAIATSLLFLLVIICLICTVHEIWSHKITESFVTNRAILQCCHLCNSSDPLAEFFTASGGKLDTVYAQICNSIPEFNLSQRFLWQQRLSLSSHCAHAGMRVS